MAQTYIWKPSTINSWKGGIAFLADAGGSRESPTVTAPNGQTYAGKYVNTNEGRHQWVFPKELAGMSGLQVNYAGQTGTIESGATSYEGGSLGGWQARAKGSLGDSSGGSFGAFQPGMAGSYGAVPAYQSFPNPTFAVYDAIKAAAYKYTDPLKFAEKFGNFNRKEIQKNFDFSKDLALNELNTELASLKDFVPAASAIKRQETSLDNVFNQAEKTRQIDSTIPDIRGSLEKQGARATAYAEGRVPDEVQDRAYELGIRSAAADQAASGGFGASSSVARKASDLLSVSQRINLSKYGDAALSNNINQRASLLLAPTEYSNAGSQIGVMPSLSSSQLINSNLNTINGLTTITPAQGLASETQQQQYSTNLKQQTNMFNAGNELQTSMFNAGVSNQFALGGFGYNVGYANSVAGAQQNSINTDFGLGQQDMYSGVMNDYMNQAQGSQQLSSLINGVFSLLGGKDGFLSGVTGGLGLEEKGTNLGEGLTGAVKGAAKAIGGLFG